MIRFKRVRIPLPQFSQSVNYRFSVFQLFRASGLGLSWFLAKMGYSFPFFSFVSDYSGESIYFIHRGPHRLFPSTLP